MNRSMYSLVLTALIKNCRLVSTQKMFAKDRSRCVDAIVTVWESAVVVDAAK